MACEPIDPPPTEEEKDELRRLAGDLVRARGDRFVKALLKARGIKLGRRKDQLEARLLEAIDAGCLGLDEAEKALLKWLTGNIIRVQGNRFIKELLRSKGIKLGRNKNQFEANLLAAIDDGRLVRGDVSSWLEGVEGWGDQHVYLYGVSPDLAAALTVDSVEAAVEQNGWQEKWEAETLMEFPDLPELTSISFDGNLLRMVWQEGAENWTPDDDKTFRRQEGLDLYEYRAYRRIEDRAMTRFELHLDKGLAALLVPQPIRGTEHRIAVREAKEKLAALLDLEQLEDEQLDLSLVGRNIDQDNFEDTSDEAFIRPQRSRLRSGGSYVEFAARSEDRAYAKEGAVRKVRDSIKTPEEEAEFQSDVGVFLFGPGEGLGRRIRTELHGVGNRIRFKAQMTRDEVWTILERIAGFREAA